MKWFSDLSARAKLLCSFITLLSLTILVGVFTGYVPGNSFDTQPGAKLSGVPCHNNAVTYYLTANPQRIAGSTPKSGLWS